jgi:hypothetical protein
MLSYLLGNAFGDINLSANAVDTHCGRVWWYRHTTLTAQARDNKDEVNLKVMQLA